MKASKVVSKRGSPAELAWLASLLIALYALSAAESWSTFVDALLHNFRSDFLVSHLLNLLLQRDGSGGHHEHHKTNRQI